METRAILAVALSLLILIVYQFVVSRYFPAPPPPAEQPQPEPKKPEIAAPDSPKPQAKLHDAKPTVPGKTAPVGDIKIETDDYVALFTNQGARLKSFKLRRYRASVDETSPPFEMVPSVPGVPYPLGVQLRGASPFNDEALIYSVQGGDLNLSGNNQGRVVFRGQTPKGAILTKEFTFTGSGYTIGMEVSAEKADSAAPEVMLTTATEATAPQGDASVHAGVICSLLGFLFHAQADAPFEGVVADVNGKLIRERGDALKSKELNGTVSWAGFGHTYFLFAVLPEDKIEQKISVHETGTLVTMEVGPLGPAKTATKVVHTLFIGPKEIDILKSTNRGLERSIDLGWFGLVSMPLLYVMHFFHRLTGSWGIDIILLTVLIKLLLAPLTHKSMVSMKQMQKLQPQMERLKEKYKDDKEGLNKEIMELYRRNKVNPFGGCLPMLLQFPVFIGLYNALGKPIELRHAPFFWIKDLSRPDWESLSLPLAGCHAGIPILTLLMGASMLATQWMTPSAGDPNQRRMMLLMPLVFTFMFINFPSGLTIYWLVNNLLSIGQQYVINRMQK